MATITAACTTTADDDDVACITTVTDAVVATSDDTAGDGDQPPPVVHKLPVDRYNAWRTLYLALVSGTASTMENTVGSPAVDASKLHARVPHAPALPPSLRLADNAAWLIECVCAEAACVEIPVDKQERMPPIVELRIDLKHLVVAKDLAATGPVVVGPLAIPVELLVGLLTDCVAIGVYTKGYLAWVCDAFAYVWQNESRIDDTTNPHRVVAYVPAVAYLSLVEAIRFSIRMTSYVMAARGESQEIVDKVKEAFKNTLQVAAGYCGWYGAHTVVTFSDDIEREFVCTWKAPPVPVGDE